MNSAFEQGFDPSNVASSEREREPESVEPLPRLEEVLDNVMAFISRFVVLTVAEVRLASLFVAHTHAFDAAEATPFLIVRSPERECGKTRLLEVLEMLVRRPLRAASVSAAALYSSVQEEKPTLLLDEMDGVFDTGRTENDDLRRLLNAGNRRGSLTVRCAWEKGRRVREKFETFCPRVLAGIGRLPETIESRSFIVQLRRRTRSEEIERLGPRERRLASLDASRIVGNLDRWAAANLDQLKQADPDFPKGLKDRQEEGAQPLLAIADLAGTKWSTVAREAISAVVGRTPDSDESLGIRLLRDCKSVFEATSAEKIASAELCRSLVSLDEGPWAEFQKGGKPLSVNSLAARLNAFGICSKNIRLGDRTPKGYLRAHFEESWNRYLPSVELRDATAPQGGVDAGVPAFSIRHNDDDVAEPARESVNADVDCGDVAAESGSGGEPIESSPEETTSGLPILDTDSHVPSCGYHVGPMVADCQRCGKAFPDHARSPGTA